MKKLLLGAMLLASIDCYAKSMFFNLVTFSQAFVTYEHCSSPAGAEPFKCFSSSARSVYITRLNPVQIPVELDTGKEYCHGIRVKNVKSGLLDVDIPYHCFSYICAGDRDALKGLIFVIDGLSVECSTIEKRT